MTTLTARTVLCNNKPSRYSLLNLVRNTKYIFLLFNLFKENYHSYQITITITYLIWITSQINESVCVQKPSDPQQGYISLIPHLGASASINYSRVWFMSHNVHKQVLSVVDIQVCMRAGNGFFTSVYSWGSEPGTDDWENVFLNLELTGCLQNRIHFFVLLFKY